MIRSRKLAFAGAAGLLCLTVSAGCEKSAEQPKVEKPKSSVAKTAPAEKQKVAAKKAPAQPAEREAAEQKTPQAQVIVAEAKPSGLGILTPNPLDTLPPEVPPVLMTEEHAATCLVKVGDTMPDVQLSDLAGKEQDLARLLGQRLTIVFFWTSANRHSVVELGDLARRVASPLAPLGVRVVGICERDPADVARRESGQAGVSYPVLMDTDGNYYERVATAGMPRTYLLDATGKILWLDMEYSGATRHDLREALRALLPQQP